jgi:hypothetical protein
MIGSFTNPPRTERPSRDLPHPGIEGPLWGNRKHLFASSFLILDQGHSASRCQNSIRSAAATTLPEKCFFTSAIQGA